MKHRVTSPAIFNLPCFEPDANGTVGFSFGQFVKESQEAQKDYEEHPENYRRVSMGDLLKEARAKDRAAAKAKKRAEMTRSLKSGQLPLYKNGKRCGGHVLLKDLKGDGDAYPSRDIRDNDGSHDREVWFERALMPDGAGCLIRYEFSQKDLAEAGGDLDNYSWESAAVAVELD